MAGMTLYNSVKMHKELYESLLKRMVQVIIIQLSKEESLCYEKHAEMQS